MNLSGSNLICYGLSYHLYSWIKDGTQPSKPVTQQVLDGVDYQASATTSGSFAEMRGIHKVGEHLVFYSWDTLRIDGTAAVFTEIKNIIGSPIPGFLERSIFQTAAYAAWSRLNDEWRTASFHRKATGQSHFINTEGMQKHFFLHFGDKMIEVNDDDNYFHRIHVFLDVKVKILEVAMQLYTNGQLADAWQMVKAWDQKYKYNWIPFGQIKIES